MEINKKAKELAGKKEFKASKGWFTLFNRRFKYEELEK